MKIKLLKIIGIIFGCVAGLVLAGFTIYVILFYPRKAESFEIITANPTKTVLIATQGSDFKDTFVKTLCDSLKNSSAYIKGIDVKNLAEVNDENWDKILIINSFLIRLNKNVDRFISRAATPDKILLFITSGGADWQPQPELMVDAITSASRKQYITNLVNLITIWVGKEGDQKWEPDDYLLTLRFFPRVDVKAACEAIVLERVRYELRYPNLINLINWTGYQFLRLKDIKSALEVFKLNVSLLPDAWNVYYCYGEALLANGDLEAAIKNYLKAVELNPHSKSANNMLKKLGKN